MDGTVIRERHRVILFTTGFFSMGIGLGGLGGLCIGQDVDFGENSILVIQSYYCY